MEPWKRSNESTVSEFIILGFSNLRGTQALLFLVFLTVYLLTITSNAVIITLVRSDQRLRTPMYLFLCNLSFLEMCYTSVTLPTMLVGFLSVINSISFVGCFIQVYFFSCLGSTENFLLALMAYDRYVAICNPLRYSSIMNPCVCAQLMAISWVLGFLTASVPVILVSRLTFCGSNMVDHVCCESTPLLKLSCSDTSVSKAVLSACASTAALGSALLTWVSYACILMTILKIPSATGRQKAFSTCAAHLIVVVLFYTSVCVMFINPSTDNPECNKVVTVYYGTVTPLLNPFIYSLRNKDVKAALRRALRWKWHLSPHNSSVALIFQKVKEGEGCE